MKKTVNEVKHAENEAEIFLKYALAISNAFNGGDEMEILTALDNNLKLWVEIETLNGGTVVLQRNIFTLELPMDII